MTPERPGATETRSRAEIFIQRRVAAVKEMYNRLTSKEYRAEYNKVKPKAETLEAMEINNQYPEGDVEDSITPSEQNQATETIIWTSETINLLQADPVKSEEFINMLDISEPAKAVVRGLRDNIRTNEISQQTRGSSFVYDALHKAINGMVTDPLGLISDGDFKMLARLNPNLHKNMQEALLQAAQKTGVSKETRTQFENARLRERDRSAKRGQDAEYMNEKMRDAFKDSSKESREALEFFTSIETLEEFQTYYDKKVKLLTEPESRVRLTKEQAEKKVSNDIQKTIRYMVYTIYAGALKEAPNEEFTATVRQFSTGMYGGTPDTLFTSGLIVRLEALGRSAQAAKQDGTTYNFYAPGQETIKRYNEKKKRIEEINYPTSELQLSTISKALVGYKEIAEAEKSAYQYQFNFRHLMQRDGDPQQGTMFSTITGFAKSLKTDTIDYIHMQDGELIQAATMALETRYKRLFMKFRWKKVSDLFNEFLEPLPRAENESLKQLQLNFSGKYEAWEIDRAFQHARLNAFGKEFMFQLQSSYADPNLTDEGEPTYLGEGVFAKNSTFDIVEGTKRWQAGDPKMNNLPYMPFKAYIDRFMNEDLRTEGESRFKRSFKEGMLAYFDHKIFKDTPPLMAIANISNMYGTDGQRGFKVKYPMIHWLDKIVDEGTKRIELKEHADNPQVLTDGFRAIENIGTNVADVFAREFILKGDDLKENLSQHTEHYKHLFSYIYTRYLSTDMGSTMHPELSSIHSIQQVIESLAQNKSISGGDAKKVLQSYIDSALTVMLYERSPTQFLYMERPRSSQNGVTLQSELEEYFIGTESTAEGRARWATGAESESEIVNYFEEALDDIEYIEQAARVSSIHKMRQSRDQFGTLRGDPTNPTDSAIDVTWKIDDAFVASTLREKYLHAGVEGEERVQNEERVRRAMALYSELDIRLRQKPKDSDKEIEWDKAGGEQRELYENFQQQKKDRISWFRDTWHSGGFGMTFTADTAGEFMHRAATGEELVARAADAVRAVAESQKLYFQGDYFSQLKDVVRYGRDKWGELQGGMSSLYATVKGEDADQAKVVLRDFLDMTITYFRRDEQAQDELGKATYNLKQKKTSVAAQSVDEGPTFDWSYEDIYDFVYEYSHKNILPQYTDKEDINYKAVKDESTIAQIVSAITGVEQTKVVRDYINEISAEGIRGQHKSSKKEIIMKYGIRAVSLMAVALIFILLKKAMEEELGD